MSLETLTERIISDAKGEAEALISAAREKAAAIEAAAEQEAKENREHEESEVAEKIRAMEDGSAASVRLEKKKFNLKERRRVIDTIYERALQTLMSMSEKESMEFLAVLLKEFAQSGDTIALAADYPYPISAEKVIEKAGCKLSSTRAKIRGGFYVLGKKCDRDISYEALLKEDREQNQAELAAKIFKQ